MLNSRKQFSLFCCSIIYYSIILGADEYANTLDTNVTLIESVDLTSFETKKKQNRKRKHKNVIKKKKSGSYRSLSYDELEEAVQDFLVEGNYLSAIKYLEQMITICQDSALVGDIMIKIADLLYDHQLYNKAAFKYANYALLYVGGKHLEYALYKAIECTFAVTLSPDRDQTKTEETIALIDEFLKKEDFTTYKDRVITIQNQCYEKLFQSDMNVCQFYIKMGRLASAQKRLDYIRTAWTDKIAYCNEALMCLGATVS